MFKKFAAVFCAFCMIASVGTNAMAGAEVQPEEVSAIESQPRYTYADYVDSWLDVSGGTAYVEAEAAGKSNVTSIRLTVTLQKKSGSSWSSVRSWTESDSSDFVSLSKELSVSSGTYRVRATAVFNGSETVTVYSNTAP